MWAYILYSDTPESWRAGELETDREYGIGRLSGRGRGGGGRGGRHHTAGATATTADGWSTRSPGLGLPHTPPASFLSLESSALRARIIYITEKQSSVRKYTIIIYINKALTKSQYFCVLVPINQNKKWHLFHPFVQYVYIPYRVYFGFCPFYNIL